MKNENIILKDSVSLSDFKAPSVKGVVVMKREDGSIIFKKNNLVVNGGRKFIRNLFAREIGAELNESTGTLFDEGTPPYKASIEIGNGSNIVTPGDNSIANSISTSIKAENLSVASDNDDFYIKFTITINGTGTSAINMSELGIKLTKNKENPSDSDSFLFSRITFDSLPLTSDNAYTLEYYLYF